MVDDMDEDIEQALRIIDLVSAIGTGKRVEDHAAEVRAVMLPPGGVSEDGDIYVDMPTMFGGITRVVLAMHSYLYDACRQGAVADPNVTYDQVWDAVRRRVRDYGKDSTAD